ncbi:MAG TPA: DNA starvation/stationary phase protection protein Dps [Gemmatimonas sp.]|nr:DNA starvation/stationary phase protection protein Dps [Gemmatimonas sp.]
MAQRARPTLDKRTTRNAKPDADTEVKFRSSIDLPVEARSEMITLLNERLADFLDLERQCKQAHWNVKGPRFLQLHLLFDETAALAVKWSDDIAERAMQLGGIAEGSVQTVAERTSLRPAPTVAKDADTWIGVVTEALACCANGARKNIETADDAGDAITADLLTRITSEADKQLWFVEAHLQNG